MTIISANIVCRKSENVHFRTKDGRLRFSMRLQTETKKTQKNKRTPSIAFISELSEQNGFVTVD